ncbi:MAG: T9SS type A sorting domain-containing protein [Bacteroidota bacterium]
MLIATPKGLVVFNNLGVITALNKQTEVGNFSVFPNPATDALQISSKTVFTKVEMQNLTGQVLLSEPVHTSSHQLNLQNVAEGIYFVRVTYADGLSVTKKIIKQ